VRHVERSLTERAAFIHGTLADVPLSIVAPLDQPAVPSIAATPDWERVYLFAADSEAVLHTPGVPELF
jgi:sn-glycerol 3-phosphate transport system ATP-binding protein/multiple sugar transport system ATP-binding protein